MTFCAFVAMLIDQYSGLPIRRIKCVREFYTHVTRSLASLYKEDSSQNERCILTRLDCSEAHANIFLDDLDLCDNEPYGQSIMILLLKSIRVHYTQEIFFF